MLSFLDSLAYGGQVSGVGLFIVFAVLVILIAVITVFSTVFTAVGKAQKKPAPAPVQPTPAPAPQPVAAAQDSVNEESELIAVITAAIAASEGSGKFVVRSVRKVSGWNRASRSEQIARF